MIESRHIPMGDVLDGLFDNLSVTAQVYLQVTDNILRRDLEPQVLHNLKQAQIGLLGKMTADDMIGLSTFVLVRNQHKQRERERYRFTKT